MVAIVVPVVLLSVLVVAIVCAVVICVLKVSTYSSGQLMTLKIISHQSNQRKNISNYWASLTEESKVSRGHVTKPEGGEVMILNDSMQ